MPDRGDHKGFNGVEKTPFRKVLWPPLAWLGLIWVASSLPGKHLPSPKILGLDKLGHVFVYLVLGLLVNRALRSRITPRKQVWLIYLLLLVAAGLDELHQFLIPQRSVSVWDMAANAAGLSLALGAWWIFCDQG